MNKLLLIDEVGIMNLTDWGPLLKRWREESKPKTKDMVVFEIAGVNHILASPLETFEFTVCRSMTDCHTYKKYLNELTEPEKNLLIAEFVKEGNTIS